MSEKLAVAYLKSVKSSPLKVMKVANAVRRMPVAKALDVLRFSKLKLAPVLRGLVYSAMSNAENNHDMDVDNLYIKRIDIGKAFVLKRFHTRGRGKSSRILKTFSNIRVVLAEQEEEVVAKKKAPAKKDAKKAPAKKAESKNEKSVKPKKPAGKKPADVAKEKAAPAKTDEAKKEAKSEVKENNNN